MKAAAVVRSGRRAWEALSVYLPVVLMGLVALGTYWLSRNTPILAPATPQRAASHVPDYFMREFSIRSFDPSGRLTSEIFGAEARHYPDTDTFEIDQPRIRSFNGDAASLLAQARRALANADGSQIQLLGDAVVTREVAAAATGAAAQRMEFRGEFLHAFITTERLRSHLPVRLIRGGSEFTADAMAYDHLARELQLKGNVRGRLVPTSPP